MIFVHVYIFLGCLAIVYPYKNATWPPMAAIYKHFQMDEVVKECYEQSGVDRKDLMEFEMTKDLEHLPDNREVKLYFRCFAILTEAVDPKVNKVLLGKAGSFFADLARPEQEAYLKMGKGCIKRVRTITDPLEFSYDLAKCFKENDNEVTQKIRKKIIKFCA